MAQFVYGRNTVLSFLLEGKVESVLCTTNFADSKILFELKKRKITPVIKTPKELDELTNGVHQGIVAYVVDYQYKDLDGIIARAKKKKFPLLIMLDEINDPHNLGAIMRSADAFGADGIIVKKHDQVGLNATVAKVSTGAINYIDVCQVTNLARTLETLKKNGYWVVASDGEAKSDYRDVDYQAPIVLVMGSEGKGISRLLLEHSDFIVKIPMEGHVNSLNVSVATAILLANIHNNRNPR